MDIVQLIKDGINKGIKIMIPIYGVKERDARKVKEWKAGEQVEKALQDFKERNDGRDTKRI